MHIIQRHGGVARLLVALLAISVFAGCFGGISSSTGGSSGSTTNPTPTPKPTTPIQGVVQFADTGIPMAATVTIGQEPPVITDSGEFTLALEPGTYDYIVQTLLGEYHGTAQFVEDQVTPLIVPAFEGWDVQLFNTVLADGHPLFGRKYTRRWNTQWSAPATLKIWVQPGSETPNPSEEQRNLALEAVDEWMTVLGGILDVTYVDQADEADIEIRWVPFEQLVTDRGECKITHLSSGYHTRGIVRIRIDVQELKTYLHEFGHCLGFEHSYEPTHIMYAPAPDSGIHETEKYLIRLLYSIPAGTPPITTTGLDN